MVVGAKNVIDESLVARDKIILPPLHIKLGLMKQFVKALNKEGSCFKYIAHKLPGITLEKLNDPLFIPSMNEIESCAWSSFVPVVKNFLGNKKADN